MRQIDIHSRTTALVARIRPISIILFTLWDLPSLAATGDRASAVGRLASGAAPRAAITTGAVEALQKGGRATLWVYFTDKGETDPARLARALGRAGAGVTSESRARRSHATGGRFIPDESDIPTPPRYVQAVEAAGARIRHVSRWVNAASVEADQDAVERIAALPFVLRITPVVRTDVEYGTPGDYGSALTQNLGINAIAANDSGFGGAGVVIAVFDTGFRKDHQATQTMRRIAEWDFVNGDGETANQGGQDLSNQWDHGTGVWSIIGAYLPGQLVGPAYNASFLLAKTRQLSGDSSFDEDHWVAAAQWADSIGVDIVSSSHVAYYDIADKDGKTTPMAKATNTLSRHGVLVVCAMGNSGPDPSSLWTPGDCDSVLAVGAVDASNVIWDFSSRGPTKDGRGKPDLVAQGVSTAWASAACASCISGYDGTSLATPLVSATAALVQEAHPEWTAQQVRYAMKSTADKSSAPDSTTYGWGRPNAVKAIYKSTLGGPIYPKPFELVAPAKGSVTTTPVAFRWQRSKDPNPGDVVSYTIQLKRVSNGSIVFTTTTPDTFYTYSGSLLTGTTYEWTVVAKDLANHPRPGVEPFQFTTTGGTDHAPTVTAPATVTGSEGQPLSFGVTASDPDGNPIASLTAAPIPPGATFSPNGSHTAGTFSWTPSFSEAGTYNVTFTAANALSGNATTQITIANTDVEPVVTAPSSQTFTAGGLVSFGITAADPDGDAIASLTVDTSGLPAGNDGALSTNPGHTAGTFTWHPTTLDTGSFDVSFTAQNALSGSATTTIQVDQNSTPSIGATADTTGVEASPMTLTATASDPEASQLLTISATGAPASLTFSHTPSTSPATATLAGTLTGADAAGSPFNIVWSVNDGSGGTVNVTTVLHVASVTAVEVPDESTGPPRVTRFLNAPNPFQAATQIEYRVQGKPAGTLSLRIYDIHGRVVRTLVEHSAKRSGVMFWDGSTDAGVRAASGVYYFRLEMGTIKVIRRLTLLR